MRWLLSCVLLVIAIGPRTARADDEKTAADHFQQGQAAFDVHDYNRAAAEFEAANRAKPAAAALLAAGLSWEFAGDLLRAAADLTAALQGGLDSGDEAKAREHVADIDRRVGHLEVVGPEGSSARIDGGPEAPLPLHVRVTPGDHTLDQQRPDGTIEHRATSVTAGATVRVDLTPEPVPTAAPRDAPSGSVQKTVGWVAITVAAAALGTGVVVGAIGLNARNEFDSSGHTIGSLRSEALTLQAVANGMFIGAGVVAIGGVVLVLTAPSPKPTAPRGAGLPGLALGGAF